MQEELELNHTNDIFQRFETILVKIIIYSIDHFDEIREKWNRIRRFPVGMP